MAPYWRTRSRSPGSRSSRVSVGRPGRASPTKIVPGRHALLVVGPGHPGDAQTDVGPGDPAHALGHGRGGRLGHHRPGGHPEDVELHLRVVGHDAAAEPGRRRRAR